MGFLFCDLHVSLKKSFVGGYKFVEFVLFVCKIVIFFIHLFKHMFWILKRTISLNCLNELLLLSTHNICLVDV